ncbi:MAG: 1,4-alpha-glucan branching protein GlgB [Alphaproteobacteria bacterium]|nr:1,4-alpha-glucan branching protein GlgB [Alphaproteobacteria bacterium]
MPNRSSKSRKPNPADLIALGDHSDPFGYLGLHKGENGRHALRSFQPGASRVEVVDRGTGQPLAEMGRIHDSGIFEAELDTPPAKGWRLRVHSSGGAMAEVEDAYRFGTTFGDMDRHLLGEGTHWRSFDVLGAHPMEIDGVAGTRFAVWAPNARRVSVIGDFNQWDGRRHAMRLHPGIGVWEIFVPGVHVGDVYKFEIKAQSGALMAEKSDPCGFWAEVPPKSASRVWKVGGRDWHDGQWMKKRQDMNALDRPVSIYEVHLGSWKRVPEEGNRPLTYREMAHQLAQYVEEMGFTHIEFLPVHEHPFDGSWGYQPIGLFAPSSRYGSPDDFAYLVDYLHGRGIGVIIDWVAGHFPSDAHGPAWFDGSHLYEHEDPRQGIHKDWNTLIYNYGRNEVANFLLSNALFWMENFHIDGLRVDAVASMLYLDYSREPGEWIPNSYGGNENLEAISFIRRMNELVYGQHAGVMTIAEESTAWPMVSRPTWLGGLGFGLKWNMGWMHDTLRFMSKDPVHRRYHHDDLTFGLLYAWHENFILPLSHDEVVHGKGSILSRMPGDRWQRFASLRAYYGFMYGQPGKKLLFMGCEFGQENEWNYQTSLDWHLMGDTMHEGARRCVADLNHLYRDTPALHELDCDPAGFSWIDCNDRDNSVISWLRKSKGEQDVVLLVSNFTPVLRHGYRVGVPRAGFWQEILNTDSAYYGGSDAGNGGGRQAEEIPWHGQSFSLDLTLPPLSTIALRCKG